MSGPTSVKDIINDSLMESKYFTIEALKRILKLQGYKVKPVTLKQVLYNLTSEQNLFDAGRGWYSFIPDSWPLYRKPLSKIMKLVQASHPEIALTGWAPHQLYPHIDLDTKDSPIFIYTGRDLIKKLALFLKEKGYEALPNPHTDEINKFFNITNKTVIIRPKITEEPANNQYATIEKILVDVYYEKDKTLIMNDASYEKLFRNIVLSSRINMARLLRYASRRRIRQELIDKFISQEKDIIAY